MKVTELIDEINKSRQKDNGTVYNTKSQKDEVLVMKTMLNDTSYKVNVYGPNGVEDTYCPSEEARNMMAGIISEATGMRQAESDIVMKNYEFRNSDAKSMVNLSKEFVNTYLNTGRKLPLGGRERSNVSLLKKVIPGGIVKYPVKVGEDKDGKAICEPKETYIGEYESIKVVAPCPSWIKNKK